MNRQKKMKIKGTMMVACFFICLAIIFMPIFPGKMDGLTYMDNLFNMISKGSSYFIPNAVEGARNYSGKMITVKITTDDEKQASETANLLKTNGLNALVDRTDIIIEDDMGRILQSSLVDAEAIFKNQGSVLLDKYGISGEKAVYLWWRSFKAINKDLTRQKLFEEAKFFGTVIKKSLEPAYNYYGIESKDYKENMVLILVALAFYVFYTVWYGFGIMYLFEGVGLKIGH